MPAVKGNAAKVRISINTVVDTSFVTLMLFAIGPIRKLPSTLPMPHDHRQGVIFEILLKLSLAIIGTCRFKDRALIKLP